MGALPPSGLPMLMSRWRDETPREAPTACARPAGLSGWCSGEEVSPGEDEPALKRGGGRQVQEDRVGQPEMAKTVARSERPRLLATAQAKNTLKGSSTS
jgi:hypothetical protein